MYCQQPKIIDSGGVNMEGLKDKVVLVTGSSRGIGAAIARAFASEGAKVVVHGRDKNALSKVKSELKDLGGTFLIATAELTKFAEIEAMREQIEREFGPVDILIANAGKNYTKPGPFEEIPEEGWHQSIEGNLTATFLTIKSFLPAMKARKRGNIIAISSAAGRRPNKQSPMPYAAAKAGIQLMIQDLADEAGQYGIRVNCIAPETILTENNKQQIPEDLQKTMTGWHPVKRLGTPEDIAKAALFLASDNSSWITGIILDVAGGAVML
jgi:3-oxoacyl-[acyl-carrier protein] reductase